jgi:hypothetical protein
MALVLKIFRTPFDEIGNRKERAEAWDYIKILDDPDVTKSMHAEIERFGINDVRTTLIFTEIHGTTTYLPVESVAYLLDDWKTIETFRTTR